MRIAITIDGKVEWYKDIEIGTQPPVVEEPVIIPAPVVPTPIIPSGPLGSKTNPIPVNKGPERGNVYRPATAVGKATPLRTNQKTWFVIDKAVNKAVKYFNFTTQGFNNVELVYTKIVQDKAGHDLTEEISLPNHSGDIHDQMVNNAPYDFNTTRFLYSIEDKSGAYGPPDVWVQFLV
jgi:hypothetical protein